MKTVVFDFDGVIHSYTSPWTSAEDIPDPPVPGIREAIRDFRIAGYEVAVVSTRCRNPLGVQAISRYLREHNIEVDHILADKPPAVAYIDDRAICFDGHPETLLRRVQRFVPWNRESPKEKEVLDRALLDRLGTPEVLAQLAEEAAELSQAALKCRRALDGRNPTPKTESCCWDDLVEEYTDVIHCARVLGLTHSEAQIRVKHDRWRRRLGLEEDNHEN